VHCVVVTRLSGMIYNTYTSTHALIVSQPCIRSSDWCSAIADLALSRTAPLCYDCCASVFRDSICDRCARSFSVLYSFNLLNACA
jgi:hypothetical protein